MMQSKQVIGDCESCSNVNVELHLMHGNMYLCDDCRNEEVKVMNKTVEKAREVDQSIKVDVDIHNAETIPIKDIISSIMADDSIPSLEEKNYAISEECQRHVIHLTKVVFDEMASLTANQNKLRAWQVNGQVYAGKLKEEKRAKFKEFDLNYQPIQPKVIKPKAIKAPKTTVSLREAEKAGEKYGIPGKAVKVIADNKGMTAEDAAMFLAKMTGKLK
jgi:hypothetical protein